MFCLAWKGLKNIFFPFSALVVVIGNLMLNLGNVQAGYKLHYNCLHNIMSSPLSFFDMTPVGRIINRFGKDLDVVDSRMSIDIHGWLYCAMRVITVPVIIVYSTPWFATVLVPLFVPYFIAQVSNAYK